MHFYLNSSYLNTIFRDFLSGWKDVSFIDRPIPLSEADEHFGRLASCGFHFIRLLTTWEAVEHEGPGGDLYFINLK